MCICIFIYVCVCVCIYIQTAPCHSCQQRGEGEVVYLVTKRQSIPNRVETAPCPSDTGPIVCRRLRGG